MAEKKELKPKAGGRVSDLFVCFLLAAVTVGLQFLWSFPGVYPALWEKVAVAAGLRPVGNLLDGYWLIVADGVYRMLGAEFGTWALRAAGHVLLGFVAVLAYGVLREALAFLIRVRPQLSPRRTGVMRLASALGAAAFVASDPVWTAGQFFGPVLLMLTLGLMATKAFLSFLRRGVLKRAYQGALLLGLLMAASPVGVALLLLFIAVGVLVTRTKRTARVGTTAFSRPLLLAVGRWHITFLVIFGIALGALVNGVVFALHDGLSSTGLAIGALPLAYIREYWSLATGVTGSVGWIVWCGVCLLPFVVSILRFPVAVDEEHSLTFTTGFVFAACGLLVLTQSGSFPVLWFWTHLPIRSSLVLACGMFLCAVTIACTVTVFGIDARCRNHDSLLRGRFGGDGDYGRAGTFIPRVVGLLRCFAVTVLPVLAIAVMVPARMNVAAREMLAVVDDAARLTLDDAKGLRRLFTDGRADGLLEVYARARGEDLLCTSLFADASLRSRNIRVRGMEGDREDAFAFGHDAGMGFRGWMRDRPERLADCAVQVGFDLWLREGQALPPTGGMLARPGGWVDEKARLGSVEAAHRLAERVLAVRPRRRLFGAATDPVVVRAFDAVVWRLARMCRVRADRADQAGDLSSARAEADLERRLNRACSTYGRLAADQERARLDLLQRLTTREGLYLALVRADFTTGRLYAEAVLATEPDNPDANFVLGMSYLRLRQLARAEDCFKRCLIRRPDESAVHNNLAMVQLERGKIAAAESSIARALKLRPGASALLDTSRRVKEAKAASAKSDGKGRGK